MRWQEARVSRAVELMVAHVENIRRRHDRNAAELEEARKVIQQQNSCRGTGDPRASPGLSIFCAWLKPLGLLSYGCLTHHTMSLLLLSSEKIQTTVTADWEAICRLARTELVPRTCTCAPWNKVKVLLAFVSEQQPSEDQHISHSQQTSGGLFFSLCNGSLLLVCAQNINSCSQVLVGLFLFLVCCRRRQSGSRRSGTLIEAGSLSAPPPWALSPAAPSSSKRTTTRLMRGWTEAASLLMSGWLDPRRRFICCLCFTSSGHLIQVKLQTRLRILRLPHSLRRLLFLLNLNLSASQQNNHPLQRCRAKSTASRTRGQTHLTAT